MLGLAALGMLGHLITHSLVDNLYVQDMYLLVALVLGMLLSGPSPKQSEAVGTGGCEQCQYRSEVRHDIEKDICEDHDTAARAAGRGGALSQVLRGRRHRRRH